MFYISFDTIGIKYPDKSTRFSLFRFRHFRLLLGAKKGAMDEPMDARSDYGHFIHL